MPRPATRRQSGFTLIEVMVAFALTMVLMIGMSALWTVVAAQFDSLVYRQKAIFRLNGEMERLVGLYNYSSSVAGPPPVTITDPTIQTPPLDIGVDYTQNNPAYTEAISAYAGSFLSTTPTNSYPNGQAANRRVYNIGKNTPGAPTTALSYVLDAGVAADLTTFETLVSPDGGLPNGTGTPPTAQAVYTNILMTGTGASRRNFVWLDQAHQIVGQLSWDYCLMPNTYSINDTYYPTAKDCTGAPTPTTATSPCYLTACYFLTVYIDYPFRFDPTQKVGVPIPDTPVETITAETIVGKRKS